MSQPTFKQIAPGATLLEVRNLTMTAEGAGRNLVNDVSFSVPAGRILGIVGESGSGKTLAAKSIMGLQGPAIHTVAGQTLYRGIDTMGLTPAELRDMRGAEIGMVFQEPMTSLNPSMLIGKQLDEGLRIHGRGTPAERKEMALDMLRRVGITDPAGAILSYPHQFSGGMRQRIMIAGVMLLKPRMLIADEPTTALDAVIQREVLELMLDLTRAEGTAVLMISHDMSMMARYADNLVVMEKGSVVEQGETRQLLAAPSHPYTRKLLSAIPKRLPARTIDTSGKPIVEVHGLLKTYESRSLWRAPVRKNVLQGIDLSIWPREVVAVVGSSGSGKTTLGRIIAGLLDRTAGSVKFNGKPVLPGSPLYRQFRLDCQFIFQDPFSSLNPRMTIGQLVAEGLRHTTGLTSSEKAERASQTLKDVGLGPEYARRYPHELSGGQRQRAAIARAVVRRPAFVVADEPVSALDMTVRAQILDLISELQDVHGFACLFISHDLGVVEQIADRVIVLKDGKIVEQGAKDVIFDRPEADYTKKLLSSIPMLEQNAAGGVELSWRYGEAG